jgi:hypothetical protein
VTISATMPPAISAIATTVATRIGQVFRFGSGGSGPPPPGPGQDDCGGPWL